MFQGFEPDDSDEEWEGHISWYYGAQGHDRDNEFRRRNLNPGMDMNQMVVESYELADRMREEAAAERERLMRPPPHAATEASHSGAESLEEYPVCSANSSPTSSRGTMTNAFLGRSPFNGGVDFAVGVEHTLRPVGNTLETVVNACDSSSDLDDGGDDNSDEEDGVDWEDPAEEADVVVAALEATTTPLFEGSNHFSMGTTYVLLVGGMLNGCSDTYMDELFRTLSTAILPQPNSLPKSYREASEYLRLLGHSYVSYDVCPNNYRLFRGDLKLARVCPECRAPRMRRVGRSEVPHKVSPVFPLTPRLKRMFRNPMQAAAMTWWATLQSNNDLMTHVSDSTQWKWINERFREELGYDDWNVRMALVTDGFNPNSDKRGTYSMWPILLMNYNIAPWLTTKNYFIMLAMLIPDPKSVTADHFNIFIEPLIEELLNLWNYGVYHIDVARHK